MKRSAALLLCLLLLGGLFAAPDRGDSHIVREAPWHPVPAAYLRSLFYIGLQPIDWRLVASEYEAPLEPAYGFATVYDMLDASGHPRPEVDAVGGGKSDTTAGRMSPISHGSSSTMIRAAIDAEDAAGLYYASTTAISRLTRHYLHEAESALALPGAAQEPLERARRIYRALEQDFLRNYDPGGNARLGLSWLTLSSTVGTAGVAGTSARGANTEAFVGAREEISRYLIDNYEISAGRAAPRQTFLPLPESAVAAEADLRPLNWLPPGADLNDQDPLPRLVLNFEERGIDEKDLFLVAYGDMLFDSPQVFGDPARGLGLTCSRCHNRSDINRRLFIPGVSARPGGLDIDGHFFNPRFNDRRNDPLDIPSLRGIRFTGPYGRDGRDGSLRDFTRNVVVNEFAGDEPTPLMLDALVAYMQEFDWLPAPYLEPDGRLKPSAPAGAGRGEVLFNKEFDGMGGRSCSTCHIASANFVDTLRHDIGSGDPSSPNARDSAFETPTLLGVAHTGPYFHDGSQETLADVVSWFNEHHSLGLSAPERSDLTAYIEAIGTGEDPYEIFDEENTQFGMFFGELTTFASTLSTLLPARDTFHADLLICTVAEDMRLDASALIDRSQAPLVYELADKLEEIGTAINADDWATAESRWIEYQQLEAEYGPDFR